MTKLTIAMANMVSTRSLACPRSTKELVTAEQTTATVTTTDLPGIQKVMTLLS